MSALKLSGPNAMLIAVVLMACAQTRENAHQCVPPSWTEAPAEISSGLFFVGIGKGQSREAAVDRAIVELSRIVSSRVQSSLNISRRVEQAAGETVSEEDLTEALAITSELTLRDVTVDRVEMACGATYVALTIHREDALEQLERQDDLMENVRSILSGQVSELRARSESIHTRVADVDRRVGAAAASLKQIRTELAERHESQSVAEVRIAGLIENSESIDVRLTRAEARLAAALREPKRLGALEEARRDAMDSVAISRAVRADRKDDLQGAIDALDPQPGAGLLDARLARGDAIRLGRDRADRIRLAASFYRRVDFDPDASERLRLSGWYRLRVMRQEIRSKYPQLRDQMMEIDGVPIPVLRSVGEMLITGGRRDEGFAVLLDEVETLDVAAFSYAKYSYHPGITGGIARHDPRLLSFFKRSADDGVFRSLAFLGEIHAYGWGVERDVERGLSLLRAAARRTGSPMPHKKMGDLLFGVGREREAIAAWREAGERGDADAWYELGVSLSRSERFDEAVEAYRNVLAIEPRMHEALINLGLLIQAGAGTPRDDEAAFALFEQALEEDRTMAAYIVATCLIYSRGAEEDLERGVELMIESAKAGYKPAEVYLQELKRRRSRPPPYWARSTPGN